jgi:hypothetical protein
MQVPQDAYADLHRLCSRLHTRKLERLTQGQRRSALCRCGDSRFGCAQAMVQHVFHCWLPRDEAARQWMAREMLLSKQRRERATLKRSTSLGCRCVLGNEFAATQLGHYDEVAGIKCGQFLVKPRAPKRPHYGAQRVGSASA